jgi:cytochrome P450
VADRRANPQEDIASKVANATINGKPLDDFETYSYFLTLATAGHDTTSASIAGGLLALIECPEEMRKLRENPAMFDTVSDEMMRWDAPVKHFFRTASEDCELGGKAVRKGDSIYLAFSSGCRDEAVFDAPDSFRVDRANNPWRWAPARTPALASISHVLKYACSFGICWPASMTSNWPGR